MCQSAPASAAPGSQSRDFAGLQELETIERGQATELKTMRNKVTGALVSAKWVQRESGAALGKQTEREIINHRKLLHPHIIRLLEVMLAEALCAAHDGAMPCMLQGSWSEREALSTYVWDSPLPVLMPTSSRRSSPLTPTWSL